MNLYLYNKIKTFSKTKTVYLINIVLFLVIYNISYDYLEVSVHYKNKLSIINFLFYILNNYFINAHLIPVCMLIIIYKINKCTNFEMYCMYRFKDKSKWFLENIKFLFIKIVLFLINIIVITLIIGVINSIINPQWRILIGYKTTYIEGFENCNYIYILLIKIILNFLYLLTLSVIFISISSLIKRYDLGILFTLIINTLNIVLFLDPPENLRKYIFLNNTLMSDGNFMIKYYVSIFYWIIILFFIVDITTKTIKCIDY